MKKTNNQLNGIGIILLGLVIALPAGVGHTTLWLIGVAVAVIGLIMVLHPTKHE